MVDPKIVNSCRNCTARCCRGLAVVLTIPEALRLVEATGARVEEVLDFSRNVDSRKTPHYPFLVKTQKGVEEWFIIIRRREGADCIFLGDGMACRIYGERPFVCRLYPYELDGRTLKKGALCPVKFAREANMTADAERLKADLLAHEVLARRWNVERGLRGERPEARKLADYFPEKEG